MRLVSVAVPVPFLDLLTYQVPDRLPLPPRGARVVVPLGKRVVTGIVVDPRAELNVEHTALAKLKPITDVLDDEAFLPGPVVDLALWVAEYYACGAGDALAAAVPSTQAHKTIRIATLTAHGHDLQAGDAVGRDAGRALHGRQKAAIDILRGAPEGLHVPELNARGISTDVLQRLAEKGLLAFRRERIERDPFTNGAVTTPVNTSIGRTLTDEQTAALESLGAAAAMERFSVFLLQGVTGSGKTEVYLRLSKLVLRQGKSVLVLVPEIALTPAVASAFREAFGDRVAVQHSGLSDGERSDQWYRIRRGEISVVVGTRSAVFAPLTKLGLIVVDEEHDTSFKQEETPRYNGRDVAVMRGKNEDALVVLGSATPSLESSQNAANGRYTRIVMKRRVQDRPLASVSVVDMRLEYAEYGPDVILSGRLKNAMSKRLDAGQQSLILLNRRGLATAVFCRQCGGTMDCPNCSVSLIVHSEGRHLHRARCHYCNYGVLVPKACPACKGPYLERRGFGTEKVAAEITAIWPHAKVARLDRDTVRRKGAAAGILRSMASGAIDVLVGTQMIAKGHDFPRVTLVGVISADVGLGLADFRAAERTFQLLTQVAGRAGRGSELGEAIVQTLYPNHYSIRHACRQDYAAFFADELGFRQTMRYPPLTALVNLVVRGRDARAAMADAATLAQHLRQSAEVGRFNVLGPAPAPLAKLRGEYRAQIFLKGGHRAGMRDAVLSALAAAPDLRRRVSIDIDPVSIL
ncbi:MAG: primosomal protein N' [Acidobacteria bacterium]|nr:primosomal protein N' [Acidobacteriota bacterium]